MKKIISVFSSISLLAVTLLPSVAYGLEPVRITSATFSSNGHGEYEIVSVGDRVSGLFGQTNEENVVASATDDSDLYHISGDRYLLRAEEDKYLLTEKVEVNINNFETNEAVFSTHQISERVIQDMKSVAEAQKEAGNSEFSISLFVPARYDDASEVSPQANEPLGYSYLVRTYGGVQYDIRNYAVKYSNISTTMLNSASSNVLANAKAFKNMLIGIGGVFSDVVSVFGAGVSVYDYFKTVHDSVITGSSGDQLEAALVYDRILKETCVYEAGKWAPSMTTHKVWLNRLDMRLYNGKTGVTTFAQPSINAVFYSEHFYDYLFAVNMTGLDYFDAYLQAKLLNNIITLKGT